MYFGLRGELGCHLDDVFMHALYHYFGGNTRNLGVYARSTQF
jgi:hypothetical protein